jgi:hypothetical protein
MELSSSTNIQSNYNNLGNLTTQSIKPKQSEYSLIIDSLDTVNVGNSVAENAILSSAKEISDKISEYLKSNFPDDFQSLSNEEITSENAANNVLNGIKMLYEVFKKQSESEGRADWEEKFFSLVKQGVQDGYDSAIGVLEELGAFKFDGIRKQAEETKILIETKLNEFENSLKTAKNDSNTEKLINTNSEYQQKNNLNVVA